MRSAASSALSGYTSHTAVIVPGLSGSIAFSSSDFDYSADVLTSGTNTRLLVNISVDAVQFNRVTQIWGTTRRPWAS